MAVMALGWLFGLGGMLLAGIRAGTSLLSSSDTGGPRTWKPCGVLNLVTSGVPYMGWGGDPAALPL